MDLILRNARIAPDPGRLTNIGIEGGKIVAIAPQLVAPGEDLELGGRLVSPGFVETHIHLDKACILDRCRADEGDLAEAIREVARVKAAFTPQDVYARAKRTLERCILNGTTHVRTHLEVDPIIGKRGLEGVLPLVDEFAWAVDLRICVFPQEGLLNNPGTEPLMVAAVKQGAHLIAACPYTDTGPARGRSIASLPWRASSASTSTCISISTSIRPRWISRTCVGGPRSTASLDGSRSAMSRNLRCSIPGAFAAAAERLRSAGVAVTVLPSTDLFLMGRRGPQRGARGVAPAHRLLHDGVNCSLASNNVLNPFTPFGDCSLVRMANLYANVCQAGASAEIAECFDMITTRAAAVMNLPRYGIAVGSDADLVVLDCASPQAAVCEIAPVLYAFKRGRRTVTRSPPVLHDPARE